MRCHVFLPRFLAVFIGAGAMFAHASMPTGFEQLQVVTEKTNLTPLIEAAAKDPNKFAVSIPHSASPRSAGVWTTENGKSVWRYAVNTPGAVSLSLHAVDVALPTGASLTLSNGQQAFNVTQKDLNKRSELWSRIAKGSTIYLQASMPQEQKNAFALTIVQLHPGFKSLDGSANSQEYQAVEARSASTAGACEENYMCDATPANALVAQEVVGVSIGGTLFCTGNLINNVKGDFKPYVLLARHCGVNISTGVSSWDASSVSIYWGAVSPCGQPLASVYSVATRTSAGATTRMVSARDSYNNTGDAWLIELDDAPPAGSSPFWAGFDASDVMPTGSVYNINHGNAKAKQYALGAGASKQAGGGFWSVSWTKSSSVDGASGSGLIDPTTNRIIGTLTGGINSNSCPSSASSSPSSIFYRLGIAWVGDGTPAHSLSFWLDPDATGTKAKDGTIGKPSVEMSLSGFSPSTVGQTVTLQWATTDADNCMATGGTPGDGWPNGNTVVNGATPVSESTPQNATYTISCTNAAGTNVQSLSVQWDAVASGGGGSTGPGSSKSGGGATGFAISFPFMLAALLRRRRTSFLLNR